MSLRDDEVGGRVAPHLEPGWSVLDLGAGTGKLARWLRDRRGIRPTLADVVDFGNRVPDLPVLRMPDALTVPAPDGAFDAVMMLFVLHHVPSWEDQERLLTEAARVARRRLVLIEDTPSSRLERAVNAAWDRVLNLRHEVPVPYAFRTVEGWRGVFRRTGLGLRHIERYRARWPSLMTYHHTLFVLER